MEITEYTVEKMIDPTNILSGDRYEFRLYVMLNEEDELHNEKGTGIRIIFTVDGEDEKIAAAHFFERETDAVHDFELEEDELAVLFDFCQENVQHVN